MAGILSPQSAPEWETWKEKLPGVTDRAGGALLPEPVLKQCPCVVLGGAVQLGDPFRVRHKIQVHTGARDLFAGPKRLPGVLAEFHSSPSFPWLFELDAGFFTPGFNLFLEGDQNIGGKTAAAS